MLLMRTVLSWNNVLSATVTRHQAACAAPRQLRQPQRQTARTMRATWLLLVLLVLAGCWRVHAGLDYHPISSELPHQHHPGSGPPPEVKVDAKLSDWLGAENVAAHRKLSPIDTLEIPVVVSLLFVGFDGNGNYGLSLTQDDLEDWFAHIEHDYRHEFAPLNSDYDGKDMPRSHVEYRFAFNVIRLDESIATYLELLQHRLLRPVQSPATSAQTGTAPADEQYQINALHFSEAIHGLLHSLKLTNTNALLVMNPRRARLINHRYVYGYRAGFSDDEMQEIKREPTFDYTVGNVNAVDDNAPFYTEVKVFSSEDESPVAQQRRRMHSGKARISMADLSAASKTWAEAATSKLLAAFPGEHSLYLTRDLTAVDMARDMLNGKYGFNKFYVRQVQEEDVFQEDCLSDVYVGRGRWAWMDLTAGPFAWGPIVGGEGVRTSTSLPQLADINAANDGLDAAEPHTGHDTAVTNEAEVTILENFWNRYCKDNSAGKDADFCQDLVLRIKRFKDIASGVADKDTRDAQHDASVIAGSEEEGWDADAPLNQFLSQFSATLSATLRHLFMPPVPLFRTPFRQRVAFHFYLIQNHDVYKAFAASSFNYHYFQNELYKFKLLKQEFTFVLHTVSLSDDKALAMAYRAALKTAVVPTLSVDGQFSAEKRHYLDSEELEAQLRVLKPVHEHGSGATEFADGSVVHRDVPIYMFSLDYPEPVLIDKRYQARAMRDGVVVVQSNFPKHTSHLSCNGKAIRWNLRNPTGAALAATITHLAGVMPPHLGWNPEHHEARNNWLWSVGDSPYSETSQRYRFNTIQRDIAFRNYIVQALDDSLALYNTGVEALAARKTSSENYAALKYVNFRSLSSVANRVENRRASLIRAIQTAQYDEVATYIGFLMSDSRLFSREAQEAAFLLDEAQCANQETIAHDDTDWVSPVIIAVNLVLLAVMYYARPKHVKLKIN